jgi:hypothetical protein
MSASGTTSTYTPTYEFETIMSNRKRIVGFSDALVVLFLVFLFGFPFFLVAYTHKHEIVPDEMWCGATAISTVLFVGFVFSWRRCSSEHLSFWYGLVVVANSKTGGTTGISALFALPALLQVYVLCIWESLVEKVRGPSGYAAARFHQVVLKAHENRFIR